MITDEERQALATAVGAMRMLCTGCADEALECEDCDIKKAIKVLREMKSHEEG